MKYNTIHSLGSRCQNAEILKHYKYREFSGFFDFINTHKVSNLIHIINNDFEELLKPENNFSLTCTQMTLEPESGLMLPTSIRTSNKFYTIDHTDVNSAIFPHHDLNSEKDRNHFITCKQRFKNLTRYNVLFNYSFNKWENDITTNDMEEIVNGLINIHKFINFKVCFIGISKGLNSSIKQISTNELYDVWYLTITPESFTGGLFSNEIDNENYINIIKQYDINDIRITKEEIDN